MFDSLSSDVAVTLLVSVVSMAAVFIPLFKGGKVALSALGVTRRMKNAEIERHVRQGSGGTRSITVEMLQVLRNALRENQSGYPTEFVVDASKQYVLNDFDARFARPISMFASILPPIGFIGTTCGLLILFLSMRIANDSLEMGALALALTSSIFALIGYAALEGFKIRLYHRMLARIDDAMLFYRNAAPTRGGEGGLPATA